MRILELSYEYPPVGGGGGQATQAVLEELARRGHTIDIVTMHVPGVAHDAPQNIHVHPVFAARRDQNQCGPFSAALYVLTSWWRARKLLKRHRYDVIHATFVVPSGIVGAIISKLYRISCVTTAHGSDVPGHNPAITRLLHLIAPVWRWAVQSVSVVTANSAYLAALMHRRAPRHIDIIPNGLPCDQFKQTTFGPTILVVGRLQKFKGVDHVIDAFGRSQARQNGYTLAVIGDGPQLPALKERAIRNDIPVTFHGRLTQPELIKLYQHSSILVSASYFEALSSVLMEGMASGLAVIATDVGGGRDMIGEAGTIISPGSVDDIIQALDRYTKHPEIMKHHGAAARARAQKHHDIAIIGAHYESVLRSAQR